MRRTGHGHIIADRRLETVAGIGAMIFGAVLLNDAYEKRAKSQPWWLRPLSWW